MTQRMPFPFGRALCLFACFFPLFPLTASASTFYKCTDASGKVLFTNAKQQGGKAKCTALSYYSPPQESSSGANRGKPRPTAVPTPGDFPRIAANEQKNRDNDRRVILEKELKSEQENLWEAQKLLTETALPQKTQAQRDTVALHERNIKALQKELGNLR